MKQKLHCKLAWDGIVQNKQLYIPYILLSSTMVMMNYILMYLQKAPFIAQVPNVEIIVQLLQYGSWVIVIFSMLFLFYVNAFLARRRKKEFGLYNILGMSKKNLAMIAFFELTFIGAISISIGLFGGILFSKLAELGAVNILNGPLTYDLYISMEGVRFTISAYGIIFLLLIIYTLIQIYLHKAITLVKSESIGEKQPKANWFLGILGILILSYAYYIAVSIKDPVTVLVWFFIAIVLVVIATYLIMISSSVLYCRLLQKNKKYYYNPKHFISISSMSYRMKRNGAGLASICILGTMVLVMIVSTTSLFIGEEDMLMSRYPRDFNLNVEFSYNDVKSSDETKDEIKEHLKDIVEKYQGNIENIVDFHSIQNAGLLFKDQVELNLSTVNNVSLDTHANICIFYLISLKDFNQMSNANQTLEDGEALLYSYRKDYEFDSIHFKQWKKFKIKEKLNDFYLDGNIISNILPTMILVVDELPESKIGYDWEYFFDSDLDKNKQMAITNEIKTYLNQIKLDTITNVSMVKMENRAQERAGFLGLFGGLFYLGMILSIIFILAAVLIIYYKQICEGYEDQGRFQIMKKIGITKKEIRRSANSQMFIVFFLPVLLAGLHLIFSFPLLEKILNMFGLNNTSLFICITIISYLVVAILYTIVYKVTSSVYYNIISKTKDR